MVLLCANFCADKKGLVSKDGGIEQRFRVVFDFEEPTKHCPVAETDPRNGGLG